MQSWLRRHLERLASAGHLAADSDRSGLARLIDDVESWRRVHDIDSADSTILGPRPRDPVERAQFDGLSRRLERRDPAGHGRSVV